MAKRKRKKKLKKIKKSKRKSKKNRKKIKRLKKRSKKSKKIKKIKNQKNKISSSGELIFKVTKALENYYLKNKINNIVKYKDHNYIAKSDSAKHVQANAASTKITFGPNSDLKLSSGTIFSAAGSGRDIVMQGILRGSGGLKVSTNSAVTFDTSSNNANYTGSLELDGQSSRIIAKSSSTASISLYGNEKVLRA